MVKSILKSIILLLILASAKVVAATPGSLQDKHIKYLGRWDFSNPSEYFSYWGGAYIKLNFEGTSAKLKTGHKTNFHFIDTKGWITANTDDYNDGAHPSVSGQLKAGNKLAEVVAQYL